MKRSEIVERVAGEAGILRRTADSAVVCFGRFARNDWPKREGRNPRAGERIAISPSVGLSCRAAKRLKDALS